MKEKLNWKDGLRFLGLFLCGLGSWLLISGRGCKQSASLMGMSAPAPVFVLVIGVAVAAWPLLRDLLAAGRSRFRGPPEFPPDMGPK